MMSLKYPVELLPEAMYQVPGSVLLEFREMKRRKATPADILAAVRTLPGVEEIQPGVSGRVPKGAKASVSLILDQGRYLIVGPLSEEESV